MKSLEENFDLMEKLNTVALGTGVDSIPSNKEWGKSIGVLKTRLLSDFWPHGEVAALYGVFREKDGFSERVNIVIDEKGVVVFARLYPIGQLPDIKEIMKFLGG